MPGLQEQVKACHEITNAIKNGKQLLKSLFDMQRLANIQRPIGVLRFSNTRKWSSAYLVTTRILRLRPFLDPLIGNPSNNLAPVDWTRLAAVKAALWPYYKHEMILQRDSSNAIHLASSFQNVRQSVQQVLNLLRTQPELDARANALQSALNDRMAKVASCGVFHLSLCLWPDPAGMCVDAAVIQLALGELKHLIDRQIALWQENADALGMLIAMRGTSTNNVYLEARADLNRHVYGSIDIIKLARDTFRQSVAAIEEKLEQD